MKEKIVIPVWALGVFIVMSNTTMFNVSIPSVISELQITADLGSWIISSYSIGFALSTVIFSRLSDILPIRRLLLIGLSVLGLSSLFGVFASDFYTLLAIRILQSVSAGTMAGLGLVMISRYVPPERRGRALTMISSGSAMAFGLGPIIGGVITQYFGYNGLFAFTCLILALLPILLKLLPKEVPTPGHFDIRGAALTVINASSLLIAVTLQSWLWLVIFLLSLFLHVLHMRKAKEPFVIPDLLKVPGYGKLMAAGFLTVMLNMGNLFLMPLVLADLFAKSPMAIGLIIAPGACLSAVLARMMGKWIDRSGSMRVLPITLSLTTGVMALFAAAVSVSAPVILAGYLLFAPCFTATLAALNNEASRRLPKHRIGSGMGLLQLMQFMGASLSVAVCGILLERLKDFSKAFSYQGAYGFLLVIGISCLLILLWYRLTLPREENSNKQAKA